MPETEGGEAQRYELVTLTREGLFARDAELAERLTSLPPVQSRVLLLNPFFWSHRSAAEEVATIAQEANIALRQGVMLDSVERLDYVLVMVANDPTVDMKHKIDFFDALRARSDELLVAQAVTSGSTGVVDIKTARPLSATYVLNPEIVLQREWLLVELKSDIKVWAGQLMEPMRHQRHGFFERALNVFIPTRGSTSRTGIDELGQVLRGDTTDQKTLTYAQLELLRLYREYVNLELAHVRVDRRMVEDQQ